MDLKDLYQEIILDHGKNPRNLGKFENFNKDAKGHNPLCGDKVHVYLKVDENKKISDIKFLKKFNISYPELEPGDVIVHHSLVVHGSSKNISNKSRRGWTIQFKDKNASYDLDHIKAYEKSLNSQIQLR